MTVLAVASPKGGVGKTTLAVNLAWTLAARRRVVLVDADPQGAVGLSVASGGDRGGGLAGVCRGELRLAAAIDRQAAAPLDLLAHGAVPSGAAPHHPEAGQLATVLRALAADYEIVVVDTPSGLGDPTLAVLSRATHLLSPLQAEPLALRTVRQLLETLADLAVQDRSPAVAGLVLSMVRSDDAVSLATVQEMFRLFPGAVLLETFVPWDPALLAASARGVPVARLEPRPAVAAVFEALAGELEGRLSDGPGVLRAATGDPSGAIHDGEET